MAVNKKFKNQYKRYHRTSKSRNKRYQSLNKGQKITYLIFVFILAISSLLSYIFREKPIDIRPFGDTVTFMSVGQADASLIASKGEFCLIDAGQSDTKDTDIVDFLKNSKIKKIKLLVITHFHSDHTSEILRVLDKFEVESILIPTLTQENIPTTIFFEEFSETVERKNIPIKQAKKGDSYKIGNGEITVLADTINDAGVNNTSIATLFVQGDFSYLNTGDGEKELEKLLIENITEPVTLFKAGHHGSSTSNTIKLMQVIKPYFVAISAGEDNSYGHPHKETMENLKNVNSKSDITYKTGDLIYSITQKQLIDTDKKE